MPVKKEDKEKGPWAVLSGLEAIPSCGFSTQAGFLHGYTMLQQFKASHLHSTSRRASKQEKLPQSPPAAAQFSISPWLHTELA